MPTAVLTADVSGRVPGHIEIREHDAREVRGLGGAVLPSPARRRGGRGMVGVAGSAFLILPSPCSTLNQEPCQAGALARRGSAGRPEMPLAPHDARSLSPRIDHHLGR
jgi:hypothetical protein